MLRSHPALSSLYPILLLGYGGLTEGQIADGLQMIDEVLAELKKYQPISVHKE